MPFTAYQKRTLAWLLIAVLFGVSLWLLGPVLMPFLVAGVLAYALSPAVIRVHQGMRCKLPRWVSVSIVMLIFTLAVLGLVMLIVPVVVKETPLLREQVPLLLDRGSAWLQRLLDRYHIPFRVNISTFKELLLSAFGPGNSSAGSTGSALGSVLSSLMIGGSAALSLIGNLILIPMVLFYLLLDWDNFVEYLFRLVPRRYRDPVLSFTEEANEILGQYMRGQLLVMVILALYYSITLTLFGFDLALPIGIFTGLAIFVPYLGYGTGLVLALLFGILQMGLAKAFVMVAVVYGIAQIVESFYLTPRLVGERMGLHPIVVIFALLAFGQLWGFVGVLVALPCSAVLLVAARRLRVSYLQSTLYND